MNRFPLPRKILILASYAPSLVNFRGPLIEDLLSAGHRVSVGAPNIKPDLRARLEAIGVEVHSTPLKRTGTSLLADFRYFLMVSRLISYVRPDIVLTYTIKPNIWGSLAAWCFGVTSVAMITGLGYAFTDSGASSLRRRLIGTVARLLYRMATSCNSRVIFQNPDDLDDFCSAGCLGDIKKAIIVHGSGVDVTHYGLVPLPEQAVFLMIARLLRNKGVQEYAEASLSLLKQYPGVRCVLVGPFDEGPDGVSAAELDRWIEGGLEYLGSLKDVRPALAMARVYVLPSYREGTPRSVLEAMSAGRPIITTDAPGCRETVIEGGNGFLVPVRSVDALLNAMVSFIEEPDLAIHMGEVSRNIAESKYDVRKVNKAIVDQLIGLE